MPAWPGGAPPPLGTPTGTLISAVFYDGYAAGDADEAIQIWNLAEAPIDLAGWSVDDGEGSAGFPTGAVIPPGGFWWLARDAIAFGDAFGHAPDWAYRAAGGLPRMILAGGGPRLADAGDNVALRRPDGALVDALVFGQAETSPEGWVGAPVVPYSAPALPRTHQVLYRKLDPILVRPTGDRDAASDWSSDPDDPVLGRRVRYPGWDLEAAALPAAFTGRAHIDLAIAPDGLLDLWLRTIGGATRSIDMEAYTFDNPVIGVAVADAARSGLRVRVLLDGNPAGGHSLDQRWNMAELDAAGAGVYWLDDAGAVRRRYRSAHAKVVVIDGMKAMIGTENPSRASAPAVTAGEGLMGRRGFAVVTDAPAIVAWAAGLIARDLDPGWHGDVRPYQRRDPSRGAPAADFKPAAPSAPGTYVPAGDAGLSLDAAIAIEAESAPENALSPVSGILGHLARVGNGGEVLVEQLREPLWWGDVADPAAESIRLNPRVAAYVAAARRGARVRVLLDSGLDDPTARGANHRTAAFLSALARRERLDLRCRLGNPTGAGIHAKVVLGTESAAGPRWVNLGSVNGTEVSSKANREVALTVTSDDLYAAIAAVFARDWEVSGFGRAYLPMAVR